MKKKNIILRNNRRARKKAMPRFISLLVMAFLGMFVFVGLTSTAPDMIISIDKYLDAGSVYDIRLVSTLGFDQKEVETISESVGISYATGSKSADVIIRAKETEPVIQINSLLDSMNQVTLLEGRLPLENDEIAVEKLYLVKENAAVGDVIKVDDENLISSELTIVGVVESPLYYNNAEILASRGSTNVGSGKISYYGYCDEAAFDMDYFTAIYARVDGARDKITSYDDYLEVVNPVIDSLDESKELLEAKVYERVHDKYQKELDDAKEEAYEKLDDAKAELDDADVKLKEGKTELDDAESKLKDGGEKLDDAKVKLDDGKKELDKARKELNDAKEELDSNTKKYQDALDEGNLKEEDLPELLEKIKLQLQQIARIPGLDAVREELTQTCNLLEELIDAGKKLKEGREEYNDALTAYNDAYGEYLKNLNKYNDARAEYDENLEKFNDAKAEYNENLEKYNDALEEYEDARSEADEKIADAQKDLDDMDTASIYVYGRDGSPTYKDYIDDANTIRNLATLFPIVFFGVAVLISLISMSRLVDDDRLEIGTLKSLGFANSHIISKYLSFALWATVIGSILGAFSGQVVIPSLINHIYKILFSLPVFVITTQPLYITIGFVITLACVCGSSVITAMKALKFKPSVLMRPKPPKAGHRIFLENRTLIWNRLNFSKKVTIRNLFRFKGKAFVTIGGIAGCTALILTGFGIKDSIVDVPSSQYYDIFQFDGTALISEDGFNDDVKGKILEYEGVSRAAYAQRVTCDFEDIEGYILVVDEDRLDYVANFTDYYSGQPVTLEKGKALVNEKLATILGIKAGDTIEMVDLNHNKYSVEVSHIVYNLIEHFIYVTPETFEEMGGDYQPNLLYFNMTDSETFKQDELVKKIIDTEGVMSLTLREDLIQSIDDTLKSLDSVVWILIILSALLAFVVLYNLSNINIVERKREIATLKVLGFYDKEVDDYIIKETLILSSLGILLGLVVGIFLCHMVVVTIEVEKCRFINEIKPLSFLYSALVTFLFSVIVSFITHFKLKKVDMIESLKSVE